MLFNFSNFETNTALTAERGWYTSVYKKKKNFRINIFSEISITFERDFSPRKKTKKRKENVENEGVGRLLILRFAYVTLG